MAVDILPHASVNVQVLVITAGHVPTGALSDPVTVPGASQLSVYASDIIAGISLIHCTVIAAGGAANTGAVVSDTVISCVAVAVLPQASVKVQVLVTIAGQVPDGGLSVPVTDPGASQLSVYANAVIAGISLTHCTSIAAGGVANTGAVVSDTVISWVAVAVLPQASVNVQVRVTMAGHVPDGGLSVPVTDPGASQLSV